MIRKIIKINEELCNGCGLCVNACHEAAIGLVDGKAKLLRDDYCDGLGNCLPACPTNAITFEEREALDYNEEEVKLNMQKKFTEGKPENKEKEISEGKHNIPCGCPGSQVKNLQRQDNQQTAQAEMLRNSTPSMLRQWPVQIQLVPANAAYFQDANLLIAADCTAYAYGDFHSFMKNKITLIGCPKLDEADYSDKLTQILSYNQIKSVTVIRMEVPCCGGIVQSVKMALTKSGKQIPWRVITISTEGTILEDI